MPKIPASNPIVRPVFQGASQNLIVPDLAERWQCSEDTILSNYRKWGLRPMRFGRRLLFPIEQIVALERRMQGKVEAAE
jgi:hypothetical protein